MLTNHTIAMLRELPFVEVSDRAHALEHSLEVHLPFLQSVLGDFRLVPVVVGVPVSGVTVGAVDAGLSYAPSSLPRSASRTKLRLSTCARTQFPPWRS